MSKRIVSLLLALCMVLSLSLNAFASNVATYYVNSPTKIRAGERIKVSVSIDYSFGMLDTNGLGFVLPFDPDLLAYQSHKVDENIEDGTTVEVGDDYVKLTYEIDDINSVSGLLNVYFQVLEGVNQYDSIPFTLEEYWANEAFLYEGEVVSVSAWPELQEDSSRVIVPCEVHDWVLHEGNPTCTKASEQYEKCSVCDAVQNSVILEPLGHDMVNGICNRCGYQEGVLASGSCGNNAAWEIRDDGTLFISGMGEMDDYIDNGMLPPWFEYEAMALINNIVVDEGITYVGAWAFVELGRARSVSLPSTLETISYSAFQTNQSLNSVTFAGTKEQWSQIDLTEGNEILLEIGVQCKDGMGGVPNPPSEPEEPDDPYVPTNTWILNDHDGEELSIDGFDGILEGAVTIPAYIDGRKVDYIGFDALKDQTLVTEIVIEEGIERIMERVFKGCTGLREVTIPKTMVNIRSNFDDCDSLEVVNYAGSRTQWATVNKPENLIPDGVKLNFLQAESNEWSYIDAGDGDIYITGFDGELVGEVTVPAVIDGKRVIVVYSSAFKNQGKVTKVTVEEGVYSLHSEVFEGCTSLKEVYLPESISYLENTFDNCDSLETITYAGNEIQWNKIGKNDNLIPEGVTLKFAKELTNQWVYEIYNEGEVAINGFDGYLIGEVTIPTYIDGKPVRSIEFRALSGQTKMTKVIVEEGIYFIGSSAFGNCTALTEVDIPESVRIMNYSFEECDNLKVLNYAGSEAQWNGIEKNDDLLPEGAVVNFGKQSVAAGNLNGDAEINSADVNLLYRVIMDYEELTEAQTSAADVNDDGKVNSADVNFLYRVVMGYAELQA